MTKSNDLYVFSHIPKTAGQYFKNNIELSNHRHYLMRASFSYGEPFFNQHTEKTDFFRGKLHFIDYVESLSPTQKGKTYCIAGHDAYHGIHALFNKPSRYITFIREPVSRTVSLYNYERMAWDIYENINNPNYYQKMFRKRITDHFLIDGQAPDFETWLHRVYNHHHIFYATMTDYLQYLNFIDDKRDEDSVQEALRKFYFVGITESFCTDADYLYHLFNVKTSMGNDNVSPGFIKKSALNKDLLNKIKDVNRDDMLLYECALRENASFKKNTKDFYFKVAETNRCRKFHYPIEWTKKTLKDMLRPWIKSILEIYRSRR